MSMADVKKLLAAGKALKNKRGQKHYCCWAWYAAFQKTGQPHVVPDE